MTIDEALKLIITDNIKRNKVPTCWADLGCGAGLFTLALSRMLQRGSTIHGIDRNNALQARTTANGVEIIPRQLDFVSDDLGLNDLDGMLMANSLHYVKNQAAFLQKLQSHLKPIAPFLVVEYDTDVPVPRWVPYPLSFSSLATLFKNIGYTRIHQLGARPSAYGSGNMYAALIS